jgi:hypothetical protein
MEPRAVAPPKYYSVETRDKGLASRAFEPQFMPTWIRYTDYNVDPLEIVEFKTDDLAAVDSALAQSRSPHDAVIRVYDSAGNVIQTHEHKGDFKE